MTQYMHELPDWPQYRWDDARLRDPLAAVRYRHGLFIGRTEQLGFALREETSLRILTLDVVKSSEIEGEFLNPDQVRSSLARRLGVGEHEWVQANPKVDGIVDVMLDATQHHDRPLTAERLFGWHSLLFPSGFSGGHRIGVGRWRDDAMQVVSGELDPERRRVFYEAPAPLRVDREMDRFLRWFDVGGVDPVLRAAIAHLWFVQIHPFDDGNGRIGRAILDMALAQGERSNLRFYSMSALIRDERKMYYHMLEQAGKRDDLDITRWLEWFIGCMDRVLTETSASLDIALRKARFWNERRFTEFNDRQVDMLDRLLEGTVDNLTAVKWAKIVRGGISHDTALRDIMSLVAAGILIKDPDEGGRNTRYLLVR